VWIKPQVAHGRIEEVCLLSGESIQNVLDGNVVLIAAA
jgi:hypothetical protein